MKDIKGCVNKFMEVTEKDKNHRCYSWEHCYKAFSCITENSKLDDKTLDYLSLHLSFYLASWGMYRGSSGLLWKDYKIHYEAIKYIHKYRELYGDQDICPIYLEKIIKIYEDLSNIYGRIKYYNSGSTEKTISSTPTLISKILLGTLGCMPALDRYFIIGVGNKKKLITNGRLNNTNYINFINDMDMIKINICQSEVNKKINTVKYPKMKIIDMYFWQKGMDTPPQSEK